MPEPHRAAPPRLLIYNAAIYPDSSGATAAAVLFEGGRVRWVGQAGDALPAAEHRIDAQGKTLLPGLIDPHAHLLWMAIDRLTWNLGGPHGPGSLADLMDGLRDRRLDSGEWIVAHGLSEARLAEQRLPTRWELDAVVSDRPVVLRRACGHAAVANTLALRRAGYADDAVDPVGGMLERREDGVPNGVLREAAAAVLYPMLPSPALADVQASLGVVAQDCLALGLSTVVEAAVGFTYGFETEWQLWNALRGAAPFPLRMGFMLAIGPTEAAMRGLRPTREPDWQVATLKFFSDGTLGSRTAALHAPYCACGQRKGLLKNPPQALRRHVAQAARDGWQVAVHAIGDQGVEEAVAAMEGAAPLPGMPHRLEHLGLAPDPLCDRLAQARIAVVTQASFIERMGDSFAAALGPQRSPLLYRAHALLERGVLLAGSSDAPAGALSPFESMAAARERRTATGHVLGAAERLSASQAMRCHTENAAAVLGRDDELGHLRVGAAADAILVDTDPYRAGASEVRATKVLLHVRGGAVVWSRAVS